MDVISIFYTRPKILVRYVVWSKSKIKINTCVQVEVDSIAIIPIYLAVYRKLRKANFPSFPRHSPVIARAVSKLYLEVRSKL